MRRALLLVLLLSLAGCAADQGGDGVATAGGTPTGGASSAAEAEGDPLKFAQCMRENGMTWFKDPDPDQRGIRVAVPKGQDKAKVDAAMAACKKFLPDGGEPPKMDAAAIEQARQMSKCMRENGVPNFPDPQTDGRMMVDGDKLGTGPGDPAFDAAEKACARFRPSPRPGEPTGPEHNSSTE